MQSIIELSNVSLRRQKKDILTGISWKISAGEHWAFVGPNGSGKTMTLRIIIGDIWPTDGSVSVLAHPFGSYDLRQLRQEIGWVSWLLQYDFMQKADSALEVVASGYFASLGLFGEDCPDSVKEKAHAVMTLMECKHLAGREFTRLSYGEQKRLLIARALINDPKLLVLDEPCIGLDLEARERFLAAVESLTSKPASPAIVFVTHHTEEIMPFVSHCHFIREGRTLYQGRKVDLMTGSALSELFNVRLRVDCSGERYWTQILHPGSSAEI